MLEILNNDNVLKVLEVIETLRAVTISVALETSVRVFEVVEVTGAFEAAKLLIVLGLVETSGNIKFVEVVVVVLKIAEVLLGTPMAIVVVEIYRTYIFLIFL